MSDKKNYNSISFNKKNDYNVSSNIKLLVTNDGVANSVVIGSYVYMPSGAKISPQETKFFNNEIILPLKKEVKLKKGEVVTLKINYKYGDSPSSTKISIKK